MEVVVSTYHKILRSTASFYRQISWECVVLDEGHYIHNPDTQISEFCMLLNCWYSMVLTGIAVMRGVKNNIDGLLQAVQFTTA